MIVEIIKKGMMQLQRFINIDVSPVLNACEQIRVINYLNKYSWKRLASKDKTKTAEIIVESNTVGVKIYLEVKTNKGQLIRRYTVANASVDSGYLPYLYLGELAWDGEIITLVADSKFRYELDTGGFEDGFRVYDLVPYKKAGSIKLGDMVSIDYAIDYVGDTFESEIIKGEKTSELKFKGIDFKLDYLDRESCFSRNHYFCNELSFFDGVHLRYSDIDLLHVSFSDLLDYLNNWNLKIEEVKGKYYSSALGAVIQPSLDFDSPVKSITIFNEEGWERVTSNIVELKESAFIKHC